MTYEIRRARPLLGTIVEIRAGARTPARAERALRTGFAAIARVHALMSFHEPTSDLSRLNRHAAQRTVRVHAWTYRVLRHARELHAKTGGLFDIATAPALVRGGWLPRTTPALPRAGATAADIKLLPARRVRFSRPLLLDLGGIAKGFAVDQAVAALRRAGATAGVVNAGGDLRVFGGRNERIHVRLPGSPGQLVALAELHAGAGATSAHYFSRRRLRGQWRTPIVDPRRHRPAGEARSVTVFARECWLADALCKVVWLAGANARPLLAACGACARVLKAPARREARRRAT